MAQQGSNDSGSSVNIVAIIAIIVLVGLAAWFFLGRSNRTAETMPEPAGSTTQEAPGRSDTTNTNIDVRIGTPDTSATP